MAFMKKDVNLGLIVLIIAAIIVFSGFTVYYQTSFRDISLEYKTKLEQLQQVTKDITTQRKELNETYSLKQKAEQDRKALDSSYREVSDENEQLKNDNSNLRSELSSTKSDLGEKTAKLVATQNILAQTQADLASANSKISSLKSDLNEVCDAYAAKNSGLEHEEC